MSALTNDPLEKMIRDAGEGHILDWFAPKSEAVQHFRQLLDRVSALGRQRVRGNALRLTADDLVREYGRNPHKVQAFLQVLPSLTPDMLIMVWRVLQGMNVAAVSMEYEAEQNFKLRVRLASPDDSNEVEEYESDDIDDAAVLRHLGIMKMDEKPLFDGFYALNRGS